jgi:hypothetical protein
MELSRELSDTPVQADTQKIYVKPELLCHGNVRDITFGSSPGVTDSGLMGTNMSFDGGGNADEPPFQ